MSISYKHTSSGTWTTSSATYHPSRDFWYVDWIIPSGATLGLYDVKVDVSDPDTGSGTRTEYGEFEVTPP